MMGVRTLRACFFYNLEEYLMANFNRNTKEVGQAESSGVLRAKLRRMNDSQLKELRSAITDRGLKSPVPKTGSSPGQPKKPDQTPS